MSVATHPLGFLKLYSERAAAPSLYYTSGYNFYLFYGYFAFQFFKPI